MPAVPGTHAAHLKATFNVNGLITAADLSPDGSADPARLRRNHRGHVRLAAVEHHGHAVFPGQQAAPRAAQRSAGRASRGRVLFAGPRRLLVSNERVTVGPLTVPQRLYALVREDRWLPAPAVVLAAAAGDPWAGLRVYPVPAAAAAAGRARRRAAARWPSRCSICGAACRGHRPAARRGRRSGLSTWPGWPGGLRAAGFQGAAGVVPENSGALAAAGAPGWQRRYLRGPNSRSAGGGGRAGGVPARVRSYVVESLVGSW
ncbi:MAG: hypothetical protein WKG07_15885 [Hymenobacter sp.]